MTSDLTRREWLIGASLLAGSVLATSGAVGQTFPDPITAPSMRNSLRCNGNENVYGPSLKAQAAMNEAAAEAHLYNFRVGGQLKEVIAKMENIPADHIAVASGSSPFLDKAAYVARLKGGDIIAPYPTYGNLTGMAKVLGTNVINVPVGEDMAIDLNAMRAAMTDNVSMIYLCNPNNPIPTIIEKKALREFCLEMSKKAIVLIDEAYFEYVDNPNFETMADLVVENENIIITRTASKIHAFAGIRVGFAFAHPNTLKWITAPFDLSMNYMAQMGAIESYQDIEYQNFIKKMNKQSMQVLYDVFKELDLEYVKSNSNFTYFNANRPSTEVAGLMREDGILSSRPFRPFTNWVRLSTVKPEEMVFVANSLRKIFS